MTDMQLSRRRSPLGDVTRHFLRNKLAVAGLIIVALLVFAAVFAPVLAPQDPAQQHLEDKRTPPGPEYPLGADEFGRDILSRVIYGSRVALFVAVTAVAIALVLGVTMGLLAGFVGGWLDTLLMRVTDI
ncbi:MAG: ABC transporter permease, partial [Caldilineaceae bacterium]|nr:ABC transporter permease [Caldilineaceae bacterium]